MYKYIYFFFSGVIFQSYSSTEKNSDRVKEEIDAFESSGAIKKFRQWKNLPGVKKKKSHVG